MQIEVPRDLHSSAVQAMEARIRRGEVPGVTDAAEAARIVRKGHLTYKQARNLAKAGTVESLTFDAKTGAASASYAFGVSAAVAFTRAMWEGEGVKAASIKAVQTGLEVGGTAFVASMLTSQIAKSGIERLLVAPSEAAIKALGKDVAKRIVGATAKGTLHGAAATSHLAKVLRGNVVTGVVTTAVMSSGDIYRLVRGSISGSQAFKNVATTSAGVAAGMGGASVGAVCGAVLGTAVLPVVGTAVGGFFGSLITGAVTGGAASWATKKSLDLVIKDDFDAMAHLLEEAMAATAEEYMLSKAECDRFVAAATGGDLAALLREVHRAADRHAFCLDYCERALAPILAERKPIALPSPEEMAEIFEDA